MNEIDDIPAGDTFLIVDVQYDFRPRRRKGLELDTSGWRKRFAGCQDMCPRLLKIK